ncbi:hypothetical protein N9N92_00725 [Planktomarina temperata]|nr:hypothetical protein [Planktomarina temperata]
MNVFRLLELASERLKTNDALFHGQADTVLGILRSAGVLPHRRSSLTGSLHKLVAAMIVQAYDDDTTVDLAVRRSGTFHHYGYSTKIVEYLDAAVEQGLLISQTGKAKGALSLGDILEAYLDEAQLALV